MSMNLKNIDKAYDGVTIFKDFNIEFTESEISCIIGPSGCGKTTLLNIIGGITGIDKGEMTDFKNINASYIFQEPRLLPWKTVRENIDFVLSRDIPYSERKDKVDHFLQLVELKAFEDYYPSQLSGGMSQRVSIARAFAIPSQLILMDEPFTGLDISLKSNIIKRFVDIWKKDRRTVIYVTHDIDEALMICSEIFVMSKSPVKVLTHKKIDLPRESRDLALKEMTDLKTEICKMIL